MPARKHKFSKCGHLGRGVECHRCAEADRLEAKANKLTNAAEVTPLLNEVKRLRSIDGKIVSTYSDQVTDP
jgi:hypothetical protein